MHAHAQICVQYSSYYLCMYTTLRHFKGVAVSLSHVLLYCNIVIEVAFTQSLFSGNETSGVIEVTIMATGISQSPYEVVVAPTQTDPSSALGIFYKNS